MRKFTILLYLFTCSFLTAQVQVGFGTGTSYDYGPINPYYGYSFIQNIYLAEDINANGDINSIKFEMANDSPIGNSDGNVDVWIGHTTKTGFDNNTDWVDVTTLTQVLTNGEITKNGTTVTIVFDSPFTYNGTDNLILAYDANEDGYNASSNKFYYSEKGENQNITMYYRSDSSNPSPSALPSASGVVNKFPNIIFGGITQACPNPNNLTVTNITATTAVLGWNEQGTANSWTIEYGQTGFTQGQGTTVTNINATSHLLTDLMSNVSYSFYVKGICSESESSAWSGPYTFTTNLNYTFVPYSIDFENTTETLWTTEVINGNEWLVYTGANAKSGNNAMKFDSSAALDANSWLYSIGIQLTAGNEYKINFWTRTETNNTPENLKVTVGTEANASSQTTTLLDLPNMSSETYLENNVTFTPQTSGVYYFGFQAYSQASSQAIYLDDFSIQNPDNAFSEIATIGSYQFSSADWGDYDNDGDEDLLISGMADPNGGTNASVSTTHVYNSDGNGNFTLNQTIQVLGVHAGEPRWLDYDNDGDLDIVIVGMSFAAGVNQFALYKNDNGVFTSVDTNSNGASFTNVSLGDYDNDGDIDILYSGYTLYATTIMKNTGNGFEKVNISASVPGIFDGRLVWADVDNDMDLDIVIAGSTQAGTSNLRIYINNQGVYTEGQVLSTYSYRRPELGDYDNDGDLDLAVKAINGNNDNIVEILINNNGTFEHVVELPSLSTSAGAQPLAWGDYDNDGDLDLAVTGTDENNDGKVLLYNNFNGNFYTRENSGFLPIGTHTVSWKDVDGDLNADILVSGFYDDPNGEYYPLAKVYKNETTVTNTAPTAPTNLNATVENSIITFNWSGASDNQTPEAGLQYYLQVGTTSGGKDVAHYPIHGNQWMLSLPENTETLYWCVKSMDTSFILSNCSEEQVLSNLSINDFTSLEKINLYPNPVKAGQDVTLKGNIKLLEIFAPTGQIVKTVKDSKFSTHGLNSGIYYVRITTPEGRVETQKLLVK